MKIRKSFVLSFFLQFVISFSAQANICNNSETLATAIPKAEAYCIRSGGTFEYTGYEVITDSSYYKEYSVKSLLIAICHMKTSTYSWSFSFVSSFYGEFWGSYNPNNLDTCQGVPDKWLVLPTPTPTPTPVPTPVPTPIPTPSPTPGSTPPPNPTATPVPTPSSIIQLSLEKVEIPPSNFLRGFNSQVLVLAQITGGQISGHHIAFDSQLDATMGGHTHEDAPNGYFEPSSCITDSSGTCTVMYIASEVSGRDALRGFSVDGLAQEGTQDLLVRIPGLVPLLPGVSYRITGNCDTHSNCHYLAPTSVFSFIQLSNDLYRQYTATVGANDLSLQWGGLFDYRGDWLTPHKAHRLGKSMDIDRCALSTVSNNPNPRDTCPVGYVKLDRRHVKESCERAGGYLVKEATYHCELK